VEHAEEFLHRKIQVICCDQNGLVALEKPCGVLSHPNAAGDSERSLLRCHYDFAKRCYICDSGDSIYLLNRLDSPVSGLVLVSLFRDVALAVEKAFARREVRKTYVALAKGFPRQRKGIWRSRLRRDVIGKSIRVSTGTGACAETEYEVEESFRSCAVTLSILSLFPITGRTHQLRVHCGQNGLPIVGDQTYGDQNFNGAFSKNFGCSRLFLHSEKISLTYEMGGRRFEFAATSSVKFRESLQNFKKI
jgi:23S rRNA-/tRNA-specific pseudouridylate synthase